MAHTEIIFEDGVVVGFISGVPDKCSHAWEDSAFIFCNGELLHEKGIRCPTDEATREYAEHIANLRNTTIVGSTVVCCKCKKPFNPIREDYFYEI